MRLSLIPSPSAIAYLQGFTKTDAPLQEIREERFGYEGFSIHIEDAITIKANSDTGFFYAYETLSQIKFQCGQNLPNIHIEDFPRYSYRAFMIDSCRHFFSVRDIKKMLENCSKLRFNVFHFHLSDDQGWRIEIKKYPELTKIGSIRHGNHFGGEQNDRIHAGFYTQEQIREIVDFAHSKHISVVPEIDLPGHSSALLASIPELVCNGKSVKIKTSPGIFKDLVCGGKESSYEILENILDELCSVFPDEYFHLGGDEAPKTQWESCPDCLKKMKELKLCSTEALQGYFTNRLSDYLRSKGKKVITWNESLKSGNLSEDAIVQYWMDKDKICENSPNRLIVSDFFHCYMDYPYSMTPLKKTYEYNPQINRNVIGIDTPIWTEYVGDIKYMEYMCFPRFFAMAQTAWCKNKPPYGEFLDSAKELKDYFSHVNTAPQKDWDPFPLKRLSGTIRHFGSIAPNDTIRKIFTKKSH